MLKMLIVLSMLTPMFALAGDPHEAMGPRCERMVLLGTEKTFAKICVELDETAEKPYLIRIFRRDGSLAEHYDMATAIPDIKGNVTYYPTIEDSEKGNKAEAVTMIPSASLDANDAGIVSIKGDKFGLKVK